jgi:hypothetical protein
MGDAKMAIDKENLIKEQALKQRIEEDDEDEIDLMVLGMPRGFVLQAEVGGRERVLATSKGEVRMFASLNSVARVVERLGYATFGVDMSDYKPGRLRGARPDRKAALVKGNAQVQAEAKVKA